MSIIGSDLSTICRLCLSSGVTLSDIFYFSSKMKNSLAGFIMKCAAVQITRGDQMPNFICQLCHTKLEEIYQFLTQIEQSDRTLRRYLKLLCVPDKPIKAECSVQPSEDKLILCTNDDIVKSEPLEFDDVFDRDLNLTGPGNFIEENYNNEEIYIKSEINVELGESEYATSTKDSISTNIDDNEFSCQDSKIDIVDTNLATGEYTVTGSNYFHFCNKGLDSFCNNWGEFNSEKNRELLSDKTTRTLKKSRQKSIKRTAGLSSEELEERKEKKRLYMKNYRAKQSKEAREARLQHVRQHVAESRASESERAKEARLEQVRQHAAEIRASESERAKEARLEQMRQHAAEKRASESERAKEARLEQMRQHAAEIRASESERAKEARLEQMRQYAAEKRASESERAKDARLQQMRQHAAEIRASEFERAKETCLEQMRQHAAEIRASESELAKETCLQQIQQLNAESRRLSRASMTDFKQTINTFCDKICPI